MLLRNLFKRIKNEKRKTFSQGLNIRKKEKKHEIAKVVTSELTKNSKI